MTSEVARLADATPARISPTTDSRLRPRRYLSVSLIATRCARFAGDPADSAERVVRPIARRSDDRGHRCGPTGCPAGDPLRNVQHGVDPGLVVGEVDDHDAAAEPEQVEPAGRALRRGLEIRQAIAKQSEGHPKASGRAGRRERVRDVVAGESTQRDRDPVDLDDLVLDRGRAPRRPPPTVAGSRARLVDPCDPSISTNQPSRRTYARPPPATVRRTTARRRTAPPSENIATLARTRRAIAATSGSSALSTAQPPGFVARATVDLTSASSGRVWIPWRSRWSEVTFVITLASFDS